MSSVLKQYGERRTGTNIIRALVTENFHDVLVLMQVLGNKHEVPHDLDRIYAETAGSTDPGYAFVTRATWAPPAKVTELESHAQAAYLRSVAAEVFAAHRSDRLGFLVSVRDPYSWAYSIVAFERWYRRRYRVVLPQLFALLLRPPVERRLRAACHTLNRKTAAWLDLRSRYPTRTSVVRIEDLWADPRATLESLARQHGLEWRTADCRPIKGRLKAALWDEDPSQENPTFHEEHRHRVEREMSRMADLLCRVITQEIDWSLMGQFGYAARRRR